MTYRSLTVLVDQQPTDADRTRYALRVAKTMDCHLVGLAPTGELVFPPNVEFTASLPEYAQQAWSTLQARAEQATARFAAACRDAGRASFEFVIDRRDVAESLLRHGHCADLLLLSQADPRRADHRAVGSVIEQVVLANPRPTLVLPYTGRFESVGQRVLVAWDDSREAARALADAMPFLRRADRVDIAAWNESRDDGDADALRGRLDELHKWLMWHGLSAHIHLETTRVGVAEAILSRAADLSSDLLVMGAYGHARWTERMLGGATRHLLASMTVPVLMSH